MPTPSTVQRLDFPGTSGATLAARLDLPAGPVRAYALFAHCFTCSKDLLAVRRIGAELAREGLAVLRFDFTGLGSSRGEFASTNFSSNIADLRTAADFLRQHYAAPALLIGHSLGGAAMLAVAGSIPEARAVVTIGAPSDSHNVLKQFGTSLEAIEKAGEAEVSLAGRRFVIRKQFVDDVRAQAITDAVATMRKALLILHSPRDEVVDIDHATRIFRAAKHSKSFVSLDTADHLITRAADADYVARVIAAWVTRYVGVETQTDAQPTTRVRVTETGRGVIRTPCRRESGDRSPMSPRPLGASAPAHRRMNFSRSRRAPAPRSRCACTRSTNSSGGQNRRGGLAREGARPRLRRVHRRRTRRQRQDRPLRTRHRGRWRADAGTAGEAWRDRGQVPRAPDAGKGREGRDTGRNRGTPLIRGLRASVPTRAVFIHASGSSPCRFFMGSSWPQKARELAFQPTAVSSQVNGADARGSRHDPA
ncbi:MAG TPA: alpha/beta hydrolase [Rhodanobacteraceae bacterium]|nr:alpha/beta hydrolase [Rhodanobacteraceae bacterium]